MSTYVVIKEYPDGHRQYRLLQATPHELEDVRHDWTRIIAIPDIHSGIMIWPNRVSRPSAPFRLPLVHVVRCLSGNSRILKKLS